MNVALNDSALSPMMTQYLEFKARYPDCILFFQVGDFYELFFEDAVTVSKAINLTLTSRDKKGPNPIPMAGVPVANLDSYAARLSALSHSIAIVSQEERDPTQRGMVTRKLERIITPGISVLSNSDAPKESQIVAAVFLSSIFDESAQVSIAFCDVQSGILQIRDALSLRELVPELTRLMPSEVILPSIVSGQKIDRRFSIMRELEIHFEAQRIKFRPESFLENNLSSFNYSKLAGFAALSPDAKRAARLILNYVDEVTVGLNFPIREVCLKSLDNTLIIDSTTRRTLELVENSRDGSGRGSLFAWLDRCASVGGSRLLRQWLLAPLADLSSILKRQDALAYFVKQNALREELSAILSALADLERIAVRMELMVCSPRELGALRDALGALVKLADCLGERKEALPELLSSLLAELAFPEEISQKLGILSDSPPFSPAEGGIIASGINAELDRLRAVKSSGKAWIMELELKERQATGISSLKIKFNNMLGYFFEVTQTNLPKVPAHFVRRQSTANLERFTSDELKQRESEVLNADSKSLELERELFLELKRSISPFAGKIRELGQVASTLDALLSLAATSASEGWVKPQVDCGVQLLIEEGRHPLLGAQMGAQFIPNSLSLAEKRCVVITGPNMGGKSTFLRQAGLIVILAQLGSFIPAKSALVGIVDKIFARMGASDDISEGESTFMVEMREISNIVSNSSPRSLLLIDEVGRGTATADGLAIARAILEWIVAKLNARTLFATHFHELTELEALHSSLQNLSVDAVEKDGEVIFTHNIKIGAADQSYGIEVAKLAGLPSDILNRARALLSAMKSERESQNTSFQIPMFNVVSAARADKKLERTAEDAELLRWKTELEKFIPEESTPLQALNFLSRLKSELKARK